MYKSHIGGVKRWLSDPYNAYISATTPLFHFHIVGGGLHFSDQKNYLSINEKCFSILAGSHTGTPPVFPRRLTPLRPPYSGPLAPLVGPSSSGQIITNIIPHSEGCPRTGHTPFPLQAPPQLQGY